MTPGSRTAASARAAASGRGRGAQAAAGVLGPPASARLEMPRLRRLSQRGARHLAGRGAHGVDRLARRPELLDSGRAGLPCRPGPGPGRRWWRRACAGAAFSAVRRSGVSAARRRARGRTGPRRRAWSRRAGPSAPAAPCSRSTSSGSLPPLDDGELEAAAGLQQRQGPVHGARRRPARPARSPSKHRVGSGWWRQSISIWSSASAVPMAATAGDAGPLAGDHVHVALDHHQRRRSSAGAAREQLARLGQAVELVALVEDAGLRPVQVLGAGLRIHAPGRRTRRPGRARRRSGR